MEIAETFLIEITFSSYTWDERKSQPVGFSEIILSDAFKAPRKEFFRSFPFSFSFFRFHYGMASLLI